MDFSFSIIYTALQLTYRKYVLQVTVYEGKLAGCVTSKRKSLKVLHFVWGEWASQEKKSDAPERGRTSA